MCMLNLFSHVQFFVAYELAPQAPLSVGFFRQQPWSQLPYPPAGDLPHPVIEPVSYVSCISRQPPGKPKLYLVLMPKLFRLPVEAVAHRGHHQGRGRVMPVQLRTRFIKVVHSTF